MTNTFIITPSREMDPVFEITGERMSKFEGCFLVALKVIGFLGLAENVEAARFEIESHLNNRTRYGLMDRDVEFARNGIEMVDVDPDSSAS